MIVWGFMTVGHNGWVIPWALCLEPCLMRVKWRYAARVVVVFFRSDGIGPRVLTSTVAKEIDPVVSVEESRQFIVVKCL